MSKYTIISKSSKGNKPGNIYTITYQVKGKEPNKFKIDLYCLYQQDDGKYKYCYLESSEGPYINNMADRNMFLAEFYKFQKGASYRKTHPVALSYLETLEQEKEKLQTQINNINKQINNELYNELTEMVQTKLKDIDPKSLNKYLKQLDSVLMNDRYVLQAVDKYPYYNTVLIVDTIIDVPVKTIKLNCNGKTVIEGINEQDLVAYYRKSKNI